MIHLKKYNESYKEPLDPESDINDFYLKFFGKKDIGWRKDSDFKWKGFEDDTKTLISENPTMSSDWEVYGIYKNPRIVQGVYLAYIRALSPFHAKVRYSLSANNKDYVTSWYDAELISQDDIEGKIDELEHEIKLLKNPL